MILPTLKQLQYLVSLHEHQHFGRAAAACNVTQSTLSAGLKELEAALDVQLVERTRRVTVFTPLGLRAASRAQDLLNRARDLADLARAASAPLSGQLRMSVIPTIAPFLLPRMLGALHRAYPHLEILLHEEMSHAACEALARGARDCLLLALPYACGEVDHIALFDDPLLVAAHRDDPLIRRTSITPGDLPTGRLLLLDDSHCLRDHTLAACERGDLEHRTMRGIGIHTLVHLVDAGLGVSLIPAMAVDAGVTDRTSVVVRPLVAPAAQRTIALAWRRNSPRADEFTLLADSLRQAHALAASFTRAPASSAILAS